MKNIKFSSQNLALAYIKFHLLSYISSRLFYSPTQIDLEKFFCFCWKNSSKIPWTWKFFFKSLQYLTTYVSNLCFGIFCVPFFDFKTHAKLEVMSTKKKNLAKSRQTSKKVVTVAVTWYNYCEEIEADWSE